MEYETRADAEAALSAMHGFMLHNRELRLDWDPGMRKPAPGTGPVRDQPY